MFECCFAWMLWKLERIDGDPVLRETRIWATWEYVSSDGGGQQGMVGLCALCGCEKLVVHHRPTAT